MSLHGKIALVTGASRGIGKAIAIELAEQGACVIGTATSENGANNITDYLRNIYNIHTEANNSSNNPQGQGKILDITNIDHIDNLITFMKNNMGMPNILVNNAGITADNLFLRMNDNEWHKVIDANLTGTFRLMRACIRHMLKIKWGRIVNISSIVAFTGNSGQANYSAAKAGIIAMSKSLAQELAPKGITVNIVAPGFVETDMTNGLNETHRIKLLEKIPMQRMGKPEDIAQAVSFLIGEKAAYITGTTLHVNGGMLMN